MQPRRLEITKKQRFSSCLRVFVVAFLICGIASATDLTVTAIHRDGRVLVSFELTDGFTPDVRDAIRSGLPTSFSYQIDLRRAAATWFDRTIATVTVAAIVRFDNLTRRYQLSRTIDGRVEEARPAEDEQAVRAWLTRFEHIPLLATSALEANGEYYVRIRANARPRNTWSVLPWDRGSIRGGAKFTFIPGQ
jgi:hypothetical protein